MALNPKPNSFWREEAIKGPFLPSLQMVGSRHARFIHSAYASFLAAVRGCDPGQGRICKFTDPVRHVAEFETQAAYSGWFKLSTHLGPDLKGV